MSNVSTKNSLEDFDMCLAIAQTSIDIQMEYAWKAWKARKNFKGIIEVFKDKDAGKIVESDYGIRANIEPLKISLAVQNVKLGQVKVSLLLKNGEVKYFDKRSKKDQTSKFTNWSISFVSDLDKTPVDLAMLRQIDPEAHKKAAAVISNTGLDEGVFSIEYLFLKLTKVDLLLLGNKEIGIPDDVPAAARTQALDSLNLLLQGELGDYVLGTVVRRNTKQAVPTFALSDFIFNVRADWTDAKASALEYLGQFAGRGLPADINAARLKLTDCWVRPAELDGTVATIAGVMAIGRSVFFEKYLMPTISDALASFQYKAVGNVHFGHPPGWKPVPKRSQLSWKFDESITGGMIHKDLLLRKVDVKQGYTLEFYLGSQLKPNQVGMRGNILTNLHYDGKTLLDDPFEWAYFDGHQDVNGTITFAGRGIGVVFDVKPELQYSASDVIEDKSEIGGALKIVQALADLPKALGIADKSLEDVFKSAQRDFCKGLMENMKQSLQRLSQSLDQHAFIPPGGGVFTFQSPQFSTSGDLLMDVIYRAP